MSNNDSEIVTVTSQYSKNLAVMSWVATLFFGFIPGLILYLIKQDDPYVQDQSKESLNWSITAAVAYGISFILSFVVIGLLLIPIVSLCHLIFCIMGAIATSKGEKFRTPFAIRLLK